MCHNDLILIKSQIYVNNWNIKSKKQKHNIYQKLTKNDEFFFISLKFETAIIIDWFDGKMVFRIKWQGISYNKFLMMKNINNVKYKV